MSGSYLRVELRSPKRNLDGGYGFDLTKYCASCWTRLGRILRRGARCDICGRRVCKRCRHFVSTKEWICALCYKKKYTPGDSWHDDANTKQFKGSQGKSGTYLLRLTDWSAHGVLEVHNVSDCQSGRIRSFYNEVSSVDFIAKNKLHKKSLSKSKFYYSIPKPCFTYPLIQRDIQLKNYKAPDTKMNSRVRKENDLKYTSTNLKQKRREMRECKALSFSRGRHSCGTLNEHSKKNRSTRIKSAKQEQYESAKTLFRNNASPFVSSTGRSKANISSCATTSWQRDHRRSYRSANNFSHLSILDRNEPHIRFSVRGTRIFGRRKSYRACPALKGDARSNGAFIKSRSSSLPCELSQVETQDYEFWNSGFVQSRVRKLEEELTSKCEDKFSYTYDYEVQSLCSLNLEKIQPDGDDYRIAYLSSTSQESSLDYMDDNYCSVGMGTLDVKLNKRCVIAGNEDWDLTFSSEENETTSEDEDDEFFYRKYTNGGASQDQTFKCVPGNFCFPNIFDNSEQSASKYGKKHSSTDAGDAVESKSIIQQIHENVDRIFCNVMQYDFDIPQPIQEKPSKPFSLQCSSYLPDDENKDENENLFEQKKVSNQNKLLNFNSDSGLKNNHEINFRQNRGQNSNLQNCSTEKKLPLNPLDNSYQNEQFKNNSRENSLESINKNFNNNALSTINPFSEFNILNITPSKASDSQFSTEMLPDYLFFNSTSTKTANELNESITENIDRINNDPVSNCLISKNDSATSETSEHTTEASILENMQNTPDQLLQLRNSTTEISKTEKTALHLNDECKPFKNSKCRDDSLLYSSEVKITNDHLSASISRTNDDEQNLNKCRSLLSEKSIAPNEILYIDDNQSNYNLSRKKWIEENNIRNDFSKTKSCLEVELVFYEPLCTPFAEIYFITYGKNYPITSCYKLSKPKKAIKDIESELEENPDDQDISKDMKVFSSFIKLQKMDYKLINIENSQDFCISNSVQNRKNFERNSSDIHPVINNNECQDLTSAYPDTKIAKQAKNFLSNNYFTILQNNKGLFYLCNEKGLTVILSGLQEIFQSVCQQINFRSPKKSVSNTFHNKFNYQEQMYENLKYLLCNENYLKLFLNRYLILDMSRENKCKTTNYPSRSCIAVPDVFFSDFSNLAFLNSINVVHLFTSLSQFLAVSFKSHNRLHYSHSRQRKKYLREIHDSVNLKTRGTKRYSKLNHDLLNFKTIRYQKSSKYDIQRKIKYEDPCFKLKKNIGVFAKDTNNEISKNVRSLKNKKSCQNKKINYKKPLNYSRKDRKKCQTRKSDKNKYTSFLNKPGVSKQKQSTRNRNYGIDNSSLKETEIFIQSLQAGENSFAIEFSTSLTSNTTFVKYLFPPQLVSVRDTFRTRLPVSSIPHIRSGPAVQRLANRESRFTQSAKNHKHGSFHAATASVVANITDSSDYFYDSQDFCVPESTCGGYSVSKTEKITTQDHDFEDYVCFGSVPKGLQQLICDQAIFGDAKWITLNPTSVPLFTSQQNMATCEENPRLISKVTRTPGKNISKLRKLFDAGESGVSDSGTSYSKREENKSFSSQSTNANTVLTITQNTDYRSVNSDHFSDMVNKNDCSLEDDFTEVNKNETDSDQSQRVSSDIPYCRKVSKSGDLWKNVNIGVKSSNDGLWGSAPNNDYNLNESFDSSEIRQGNNSLVSSTSDLHLLIAASKAELSKKKEPLLSDKSTLENYFTSFENSKPKKLVPLSPVNQSSSTNDFSDLEITRCENFKTSVSYDCDAEEMIFDEEDAVFSDTSSDEEIRCNPPLNNNHYLPAYALHTIIEESCEESERDSRNTTPTNEPMTSKLERYFSWDIINDTETDVKRKEEDASTVYSDSLSEGSGSLNGDVSKEIDPTQLASSRLEKYFTSGLVGNENYFYPDDAEFLEDGPVSDFEEDSIHQKISRSALLSSLENVAEKHESEDSESIEINIKESESVDKTLPENVEQSDSETSLKHELSSSNLENCDIKDVLIQDSNKELSNEVEEIVTNDSKQEFKENELTETTKSDEIPLHISNSSPNPLLSTFSELDNTKNEQSSVQKSDTELVESIVDTNDVSIPKSTVNKEQLAIDVRAIIKKLLMYFSDSEPNSFKHNIENDYISAWQILETEIERLIQSISPPASIENNSCNNSTIDSNNSDYGSDTVESLECMTDEDETNDSKSRGNAKYPIVDLFNAAYKIQPGSEFHNFNISDETLSIWKRLIQSLQKDNFCMNDKLYDPNTEARLYIRDQIINLMHTVTVNENKVEKTDSKVSNVENGEITLSLIEEKSTSDDINEAFNVSVSGLPFLYSNDVELPTSKTESLDDDISVESCENLKTVESVDNISDNESKISNESNIDLDSDQKANVLENSCVDTVNKGESLNADHCLEEVSVNEIDIQLNLNNSDSADKLLTSPVDVELNKDDDNNPLKKYESHLEVEYSEVYDAVKRSSLHLWVSGENESEKKENADISSTIQKEDSLYVEDEVPNLPESTLLPSDTNVTSDFRTPGKSCRDTGYYSFKSSDDSILHDTPPPDEFMDVPNFKSLKRSVKKFPLGNTLSKSSTNINHVFSNPDSKFSTLQLKNQKSKGSNSNNSPSRQFTSLFSPTAVFKKLTGSKGNDASTTPDSSIPSKYLKKYARSPSVETENMIGAISMPQLNYIRPGDSYSALGLYSENDRDSSLIADDDVEGSRYPAYSQSVLSLGAHSASMTSVYSAAACHYGYVTVSGDVLFGLNYNQKSQMMEVFVKQCRNLAAVDIKRNKSDPYVKVYLLPDKTKGGKRKTKTKKNTLNPIFNELLRFPVLKHELESRTLWLSVWNSDLFGRNDFLGEVMLPLGYRLLDSPTLRWYPLQERMESLTSPLNYRGELFLALKYVPRDLSLESRFRPAPVISLRGALHVLVKEARNISANGSGGNLDAFCKSYLLPDKSKSSKQKTPVVKRSRHPKWYYTMIYEDLTIDELKERSLELTVWDHDKITSNEFMGGIRLNMGSGLYHGVSVEWMDARRDEAALWEAMLQSPNMWVDGCLPLRPTMQFHHGY